METSNSKSAIVDKIKKSTTILVTVSHDPSVDALAAALSFTLMLNKLEKSATAVFSGAIPPAITFLDPEKTFEGTVDSLRDFIIALDKAKADRLRYKVEGDVVRIYITPYKTNLSENDLQFSQGDFNVDLVIALGVEKQSDLDNAIAAHGRILHDAAVATINNRDVKSSIGTMDWSDEKASSLCEMLMSLSEALQPNLLDEQIATGLLTGIVAATNRFSNEHTTPRVMTMSAQLMAAGANQQLIAEKLQAGGVSFDTITVHDQPTDQPAAPAEAPVPDEQPAEEHVDGEMHVSHDEETVLPPVVPPTEVVASTEPVVDPSARLEQALGHTQPLENFRHDLEEASHRQQDEKPVASTDWRDHVHDPYPDDDDQAPLMGGTLNATTSEAEEAKRAEERSARNHTILSHDAPPAASLFAVAGSGSNGDEPADVDMFAEPPAGDALVHDGPAPMTRGRTIQPVTMAPIATPPAPVIPVLPPAPVPAPPSFGGTPSVGDLGLAYEESPLPSVEQPAEQHNQTLADLEAEVHAAAQAHPATSSIDDARDAVQNAFGTQPLSVGGQPSPAFPVHDTVATAPAAMPPMPDFSTLPPLPPMPGQDVPNSPHPAVMPPTFPATPHPTGPLAPPAPGQFKIPGQG
ncbi:MAG: hypothetical protein WAT17_02675 [Candidatus Saccharimonadales bacterium]|jgi:nanoRNase/pAp phosphatase (c-di-AMP/oligoRNAs hydrolase)